MGGQLLSTQPVAGPLGSPFVLLATDGFGVSTGVTFGAFETSGGVGDQNWARVMRYRGYQTWVVVQRDTIYRTTDAGATWTAVFGPDADLGTTTTKSGLWLVYRSGAAQLVIVGYDGAGGYSLFTSTDGVTWTKGAKYALTAQTTALHANAIWRCMLFSSAGLGGSARTYIASWGQDLISQLSPQPDVHGTQNDSSFCVFNDRLFGAWTKASDGAVGLYELVSFAWVLRATLAAAAPSFAADRKITLFVDRANMYAIFMTANPDFPVPDPVNPLLWVCIEIDSALTVTPRPVPLAGIHGGETNGSRVASIADGPAGGSGTLPEIDLYFSTDGISGTGVAVYRFNGSFAAITPLAGGNNVQNAWPFGRQYSGNVFWAVGTRAIEKVSAAPAPGGVRWSFTLYSPNPSIDTVSVRGFQGVATDEYACGIFGPNSNPVLANPSAGTLIGQTITGLDAADNGATTFTVDWLALTNGGFPFAVGDYAKTVLEVF
jgi:hypothetical protein